MIGISGILGGLTLFSTSGLILSVGGPGGVLIAWAINGAIAVAVMEGLSEMIELWPISNAMMEFVDKFVDKDLALVVGIAYWYDRQFSSTSSNC
jgi:amino acid transporter